MHFYEFFHNVFLITGGIFWFLVLVAALSGIAAALSTNKCGACQEVPDMTQQAQPQTHTYAVTLDGDGGLFLIPGVFETPFFDEGFLVFTDAVGDELARFRSYTVVSAIRKVDEAAWGFEPTAPVNTRAL